MEYTQEVNTLSDKEYLNFINSPKLPATKKQYAYLLSIYMKFLNIKDPAQLLFHITKEVEQHLIDYIVYLRDEKKDNICYSQSLRCCSFHILCNEQQYSEQKENLQIFRGADSDTSRPALCHRRDP